MFICVNEVRFDRRARPFLSSIHEHYWQFHSSLNPLQIHTRINRLDLHESYRCANCNNLHAVQLGGLQRPSLSIHRQKVAAWFADFRRLACIRCWIDQLENGFAHDISSCTHSPSIFHSHGIHYIRWQHGLLKGSRSHRRWSDLPLLNSNDKFHRHWLLAAQTGIGQVPWQGDCY